MSTLMHSIWTIIVFVVFIGIVVWAYSSRRKKDFDEASRLALDDDKPETSSKTEEDKS
ncbi:MAG: cbb3-type cytochrome c oxidase subunit 3 [Gammaproteobacteria bacterium]|nr:cbb3-type cytochrome c oxidase subunit 3 [Gammaproteobacteria bacterium]